MSFNITGEALIGGVAVQGTGAAFEAWDPAARAHIAPSFQTRCTRSDPPTPSPARTRIDVGKGAAAQLCGALLLPLRNVKSLTDSGPWFPATSIIRPLIPRV